MGIKDIAKVVSYGYEVGVVTVKELEDYILTKGIKTEEELLRVMKEESERLRDEEYEEMYQCGDLDRAREYIKKKIEEGIDKEEYENILTVLRRFV